MEKLLTAEQVSDHLGMHIKTLYKALRENKIALKFIRTHGRKIAFRPSDVESYLSTHEVVRDASGTKNKKKKATREVSSMFMSDEQAQEFFTGITAREDEYTGAV